MPIYPRSTKTKGQVYDVVFRHEGRTVWRRGFPTKKAAKEEEVKLRYETNRGGIIAPGRLTLGDYLTKRWYPYKAPALDDRSQRLYRAVLNRTKPLHEVRLTRLSPMDIQGWTASLNAAGLKPATVSVYLAVLKSALAQAVKWEALSRNPATVVSGPRRDSRTPPILTVAQIAQLFEEAEKTPLGPIVHFAILTGMRWGELTARRWDEVDLERGEIRIKDAKTERGNRAVALGPEALDVLTTQRRRQTEMRLRLGPAWPDTGLIFTTEGGTQHKHAAFTERWHKLAKAAGLPGLHFHDLRHVHATLLARAGVHPRIMQDRLGHADTKTTMQVYTHVSADSQRDAALAVEELLRRAT